MTSLLAYNTMELITTVKGFTVQVRWSYLPIVSESGLGTML